MKLQRFYRWLGILITSIGVFVWIDYLWKDSTTDGMLKLYQAMFLSCFTVGPILIFAAHVLKVRKMKYYRTGHDFPDHFG